MTLMPQLTVWEMPVGCSEAQSSGQPRPVRPLWTQIGSWFLSLCPRFCLLQCGSTGSPLCSHLYLHPTGLMLWPQDPAELREGSAPKEVGVHAGPRPLAHPPFQGKEGPR